jgi:hypothetical protein
MFYTLTILISHLLCNMKLNTQFRISSKHTRQVSCSIQFVVVFVVLKQMDRVRSGSRDELLNIVAILARYQLMYDYRK